MLPLCESQGKRVTITARPAAGHHLFDWPPQGLVTIVIPISLLLLCATDLCTFQAIGREAYSYPKVDFGPLHVRKRSYRVRVLCIQRRGSHWLVEST